MTSDQPPVDDPSGHLIDEAWRLLTSVNEWIRFADAKAAGALAGAGVIAGALATAAAQQPLSCVNIVALVLGVISAAAAVAAAGLAVWTLLPTLRVGEPLSLIYFEHVARKFRHDQSTHAREVRELILDETSYFDQIAAQIWAVSVVARSKFLASTWSLSVLGLSIILAAISGVFAIFG